MIKEPAKQAAKRFLRVWAVGGALFFFGLVLATQGFTKPPQWVPLWAQVGVAAPG